MASRAGRRKVVGGLAYKILGPTRYECCRCEQVVEPTWDAGFAHVCMPSRLMHASGKLVSYNPNAPFDEQLEALSTLFASLASQGWKITDEVPF